MTDNDGAADAFLTSATVSEPTGGSTMHIADLDGVAVASGRRWTAVVKASVVKDGGGAVPIATVKGAWKDVTSGVCTTDGVGTCSLELGNLRAQVNNVHREQHQSHFAHVRSGVQHRSRQR